MASLEETLGEEFFTQPQNVITNTAIQLMYSNLVQVFKEEITERGGSVLDIMLGERAAFLYAYQRNLESDPESWERSAPARTRREMTKDLIDLLTNIKKLWMSEDRNDGGERVLAKVNKAIFDAIKEMPEEQGKALQRDLAASFEANGL